VDAARLHASVSSVAARVCQDADASLSEALSVRGTPQEEGQGLVYRLWNPAPFSRTELVALPVALAPDTFRGLPEADMCALVSVAIPGYGFTEVPVDAGATLCTSQMTADSQRRADVHVQICDAALVAGDASPLPGPQGPPCASLQTHSPHVSVIRDLAEIDSDGLVAGTTARALRVYDFQPVSPYVPRSGSRVGQQPPPGCDPSPAATRADADAQPAFIVETGPLLVRVSKVSCF
jgi:hypothetical protein